MAQRASSGKGVLQRLREWRRRKRTIKKYKPELKAVAKLERKIKKIDKKLDWIHRLYPPITKGSVSGRRSRGLSDADTIDSYNAELAAERERDKATAKEKALLEQKAELQEQIKKIRRGEIKIKRTDLSFRNSK